MRSLPLLLLAVTTSAADLPNGGAIDAIAQREGRGYRPVYDSSQDQKPSRVLLIGDSILNGYQQKTRELLSANSKVDARVIHTHPLERRHLKLILDAEQGVRPYRPYDVVVLHQSIDNMNGPKLNSDSIGPLTKKYVEEIRSLLPKARLIWASATPITEKDLPKELNAKINPIIIERNRIVAKVMEEMNVEVIDLYGLLVDKTHLAYGNMTHWKEPAYDLISQKVAETILKEKSGN
jgi:lysophospholipase L1-like esterase